MDKGLCYQNCTYLNVNSLKFTKYLFQEALSSFEIIRLADKLYCKQLQVKVKVKVKVKAKQSRYRPGQAQRVPGS